MNFYSPLEKQEPPKDGDTRKVKRFSIYKRIGDYIVVLGWYNEVWTYRSMNPVAPWGRLPYYEVIPSERNKN